jgi:hypothetical protein
MVAKRASFGPRPAASVEQLYAAFARGRTRRLPGNIRSAQTAEAAASADQTARYLLRVAQSNDELLAAAEHLGFVHHVADLSDERMWKLQAAALLGHAYRGFDSADRDVAKNAAHNQLVFAAERFARLGYLRSAAIEKTNAAMALLEKHVVTDADLRSAHQYLAFSRQHKDPDSIDLAYTEFTTSVYHVQLPAQSTAHRVEKLHQARQHMESASAIFHAHSEPLSVVVAAEYAHLLAVQYEAAVEHRVAAAVLDHRDELPPVLDAVADDVPLIVGGILQGNPVSVGLVDTPPWLVEAAQSPIEPNISADLARAARELRHDLAAATESDRLAISHAKWWLARVEWELDKTPAHLVALYSAADDLSDDRDQALFVENGIFACWTGRIHLGTPAPPSLLIKIASAYLSIVTCGDQERIARFVRDFGRQIRLVACALADQQAWEEAAHVLETTRLLIYGRHAIQTQHDDRSIPTAAWVYVTHSPEATYIIVCQDGKPVTGQRLLAHNGKRLTQLVLSYRQDEPGLLTAHRSPTKSDLTDAAIRAMDGLTDVCDAIVNLTSGAEDVLLILSGLYAALPITAAVMDRHPTTGVVAAVPARQAVNTEPADGPLGAASFHGLIAATVPGQQVLTYPAMEVANIARSLTAIPSPPATAVAVADVTRNELYAAATRSDIIHYSGHSYVDTVEPLRSALVLQDCHLSIADILDLDLAQLKLLTLSSCASSTASVTTLGSEYLGIHSAFHYAGCRFAVGTLWPVFDLTAAMFMTRFYDGLARTPRLDLHSVYAGVRATQQWMKNATVREVKRYAAQLDPAIDLPITFAGIADHVQPFGSPRNWAAFFLSTRSM